MNGPRVITLWTGEVICIDCELAGWSQCEWHKPRSQATGIMQMMPSSWRRKMPDPDDMERRMREVMEAERRRQEQAAAERAAEIAKQTRDGGK